MLLSISVLAPQATSSARTPGKTGGQKAAGSGAASKTPVKPKGRIRKMPKSPEYVSSGSERYVLASYRFFTISY